MFRSLFIIVETLGQKSYLQIRIFWTILKFIKSFLKLKNSKEYNQKVVKEVKNGKQSFLSQIFKTPTASFVKKKLYISFYTVNRNRLSLKVGIYLLNQLKGILQVKLH